MCFMSNPLFFDEILKRRFGDVYLRIYAASPLLQYLSFKTKSVDKSSKSRANFANLYAIFVLVEDYINQGYDTKGDYSTYKGAIFSALFRRQRQLPFGQKLQNHALNNRCNDEFRKYFPRLGKYPIIRDLQKQLYWFDESLLKIDIDSKEFNIAKVILEIIHTYTSLKEEKYSSFFDSCLKLQKDSDSTNLIKFIQEQLRPNIDARIFEIVSF